MQSVNVKCIQVYPCAYWRRLVRFSDHQTGPTTTGFDKSTWPPTSSLLCWHCCHPFDNIPAFYPVSLDVKTNVFYFMGNFCSWNCVKGYAVSITDHKKPNASSYISLVAFLTVHRPKHCLQNHSETHSYDCPCLDIFKGVPLPPKKELLHSFGGTMTIEEYRKNFLIIENYKWVVEYFHKNNQIIRELDSLSLTQKRRAYTYSFVTFPGPSEATIDRLYLLPLTNQVFKADPTDPTDPTNRNYPQQLSQITRQLPQQQSGGRTVKPCNRANPGGRRRFPRSAQPSSHEPPQETAVTSSSVSATSSISSISATLSNRSSIPSIPNASTTSLARSEPKLLLTRETSQTKPAVEPQRRMIEPAVSEEQAFYISRIHKYGNLMTSMGLKIEKKNSVDRTL